MFMTILCQFNELLTLFSQLSNMDKDSKKVIRIKNGKVKEKAKVTITEKKKLVPVEKEGIEKQCIEHGNHK